MGFIYGDLIVVKIKKYGWIVVVLLGYNNVDGMGWFFIFNLKMGVLLELILMGVGFVSSFVGFVYVFVYVVDYIDNMVDFIYVGDLLGNVWCFDFMVMSGVYLVFI